MTFKKVGGMMIGIILVSHWLQSMGLSAIVETRFSFGVSLNDVQVGQ